jgi:hypothetical protein
MAVRLHGVATVVAAAIAMVAAARPASAQTFQLDLMGGTAYNVPTPLTIRQSGFPDIHVTAHYDTKPLGPYAPYYSWRLSLWNDTHTSGWEIQQVHHRIFLSNTSDVVQFFAIHFGYNYFLAGHAWAWRGFEVHADGGVIISSPQNTVRNATLPAVGYGLSGVGGALAIGRHVVVTPHFYLLAEGGLLAGHANVPVVSGSASVPNVGLHAHLGAGITF